MNSFLRRLYRLYDADGGTGGGGAGGGDGSNAGGDGDGGDDGDGDDNAGDDGKTFTQAELDAIVKRRLARAKKEADAEREEAERKAKMDENERLKAEKQEAERKAQDAIAAANARAVRAEAKAQAASLGVKPDRLDYVLKLADLTEIEPDEDGEIDTKAVKAAVERVLKDLPELKGDGAGAGANGGEFNGGGSDGDKNPWAKDSYNLTEQGRIMKADPDKAARLRKAAGG